VGFPGPHKDEDLSSATMTFKKKIISSKLRLELISTSSNVQSCRVVVNPSGLWSQGQWFESAQDYKNLKDLDPSALYEIIKLQAKRITELEADFEALGNTLQDWVENVESLERKVKAFEINTK
jgi:hypothetical protein